MALSLESVLAYQAMQWPHLAIILASLGFWTALYGLSLRHSGRFSKTFQGMNDGLRRDWASRVVGFTHAVFIIALSAFVLQRDGEYLRQNTVNNTTPLSNLVCSIAVGYFLWDLGLCVLNFAVFGPAFFVHGLLCSIVYILAMVRGCGSQ